MKPMTHLFIMNTVIDNVRSTGGYVDIPPYGRFPINPEFSQIIKNKYYDSYLRAGAIGPDGFPDMLTGQSEMHTSTDTWIEYLYSQVRKQKSTITINGRRTQVQDKASLAFYLGYLSHCCADVWAHDWVNYYAGDKWPKTSDLIAGKKSAWDNVLKHISIEMTLNDQVMKTNKVMGKSVRIPKKLLFDCMINSVHASLERNKKVESAKTFTLFNDLFIPLYWGLKEFENAKFLRAYRKAWHKDVKTGISAWISSNEKAMQSVANDDSMVKSLKENWSSWGKIHFLSMLGTPDIFSKFPATFAQKFNIKFPLVEKFKKFVADEVCKAATGMTTGQLNKYLSQRISKKNLGNDYAKVVEEIGTVPSIKNWNHRDEKMSNINGPLYNSIIMTKMSLLHSSQLKRLYKKIHNKELKGTINRIPHQVRMLDGSGQFKFGLFAKFYNKMKLDGAIKGYTSHYHEKELSHGRNLKDVSISSIIRSVGIRIKTKNKKYAGTDCDIHFDIIFSNNKKKSWKLDKKGYNDFERGDNDWYYFWWNNTSKYRASSIRKIQIRMGKQLGAGKDWDCEDMSIKINGGKDNKWKVNKCFKRKGAVWAKNLSNGIGI